MSSWSSGYHHVQLVGDERLLLIKPSFCCAELRNNSPRCLRIGRQELFSSTRRSEYHLIFAFPPGMSYVRMSYSYVARNPSRATVSRGGRSTSLDCFWNRDPGSGWQSHFGCCWSMGVNLQDERTPSRETTPFFASIATIPCIGALGAATPLRRRNRSRCRSLWVSGAVRCGGRRR
jgi:hypothetical protein